MRFLPAFVLLCAAAFAQIAERPPWIAPADAAARPNPLKDKPELASGGRKIFLRSCTTCHAAGPGQKGPDLSRPATQEETDGALFWKISSGNSRAGMPDYRSLPDGQRWQLVLYIRSLARRAME